MDPEQKQVENSTYEAVAVENSTFLRAFDEWRSGRGLTEELAAREIGYSRSWIQKARAGQVKVKRKALDAFSRVGGPAPVGVVNETATPFLQASKREKPPADLGRFKTAEFQDYLAFLRQCREESERVGGGDAEQMIQIFDRLLATWTGSIDRPNVKPGKSTAYEEALRQVIKEEADKAPHDTVQSPPTTQGGAGASA